MQTYATEMPCRKLNTLTEQEYGQHQHQTTKQTKMMQAKMCVHVCKLDKVRDQC